LSGPLELAKNRANRDLDHPEGPRGNSQVEKVAQGTGCCLRTPKTSHDEREHDNGEPQGSNEQHAHGLGCIESVTPWERKANQGASQEKGSNCHEASSKQVHRPVLHWTSAEAVVERHALNRSSRINVGRTMKSTPTSASPWTRENQLLDWTGLKSHGRATCCHACIGAIFRGSNGSQCRHTRKPRCCSKASKSRSSCSSA